MQHDTGNDPAVRNSVPERFEKHGYDVRVVVGLRHVVPRKAGD
jgi:hypothetical protein